MDELKTYRTGAKNPKITQRSAELAKHDDVKAKRLKLKEAQWKLQRHNLEKQKLEENIKKCHDQYEAAKKILESNKRMRQIDNKHPNCHCLVKQLTMGSHNWCNTVRYSQLVL